VLHRRSEACVCLLLVTCMAYHISFLGVWKSWLTDISNKRTKGERIDSSKAGDFYYDLWELHLFSVLLST
jgi:hypothetical protein